MSAQKRLTRTSGADQSPERINDPPAGLDRLRHALKRILSVSKSDVSRRAGT